MSEGAGVREGSSGWVPLAALKEKGAVVQGEGQGSRVCVGTARGSCGPGELGAGPGGRGAGRPGSQELEGCEGGCRRLSTHS